MSHILQQGIFFVFFLGNKCPFKKMHHHGWELTWPHEEADGYGSLPFFFPRKVEKMLGKKNDQQIEAFGLASPRS